VSLEQHTAVRDRIRDSMDDLVLLTQELVRIPSISGKENDVQTLIARRLGAMGLSPQMVYPDVGRLRQHPDFFETTSFLKYGYENRPNVVARLLGSGGGRSICLAGHVDVVSPEPVDKWTHGPWSGDVHEGRVYGRGAADMKGGLASMIIAVKAIRESGLKLKGDVHLETTIEEEDGGIGGSLFLRMTQPRVDAALNPEPSGLGICIASAGVMYFRVVVPGVPAHAAWAHIGVNAILKMNRIVDELNRLNERRQARIRYPYAEASDPRMKGRSTTLNIGVIRGGDWPSTVPGRCEIECRIGWPPGETREQVMAEVQGVINTVAQKDSWLRDNPPRIEWFGWRARPHEQDVNHPFVKLLKEQVTKAVGRSPVFYGGAAGLDTRFFAHDGIASAMFGPKGDRTHSTDECVEIDSMVKSAEVIAATIVDWCGVA